MTSRERRPVAAAPSKKEFGIAQTQDRSQRQFHPWDRKAVLEPALRECKVPEQVGGLNHIITRQVDVRARPDETPR